MRLNRLNIKILMLEEGLTMKELANWCDVSIRLLTYHMSGNYPYAINHSLVESIAARLGVNTTEILK